MSDGKEILRRLLLVVGAVVSSAFAIFGLALLIDGSGSDLQAGTVLLLGAVFGFFAWRWVVHWVLLYKAPTSRHSSF